MKNCLFGLIFLISNLAWAMQATEVIESKHALRLAYFNYPCFFSMVEVPLPNNKIEIVMDDDGFFTLFIAVLYLQQENNNKLRQIVKNALDRLKQSRKKMTNDIVNLSPDLSALAAFVNTNRNKFTYEVYDERRDASPWCAKYFTDLMEIKAPLPPISIILATPLDGEVNSKTSSVVLSKTVAIEKSSHASIHEDILKKMFSSANELDSTSSSSEYDAILGAFQAIETAFPLSKKIRLHDRANISARIAILPADKAQEIKQWATLDSEDAVSKLKTLLSPQYKMPTSNGTMPLFIYSVSWNGGLDNDGEYRFWIFEVNQISPDTFCVTLKYRLGSEPESPVLELMFPKIDSFFSEIYSL